MKRSSGLIGACMLGGMLLVLMATWVDHQLARALTPPPGCETIDADISSPTEVWSLARAPCYRITTSTVAIQAGAWLTIEAGVGVYFDAGSRLQISQNAGLTAIGTDLAPILFTSAITTGEETRCDWNGIIVNSEFGPPVRIQYAIIEYACVGIDPGGRRDLSITHNEFRYNGDTLGGAVVGDADDSSISHNTIYNCQNGIVLNEAGDNELRNNTIDTIEHDGIAFIGGGVGGGARNLIASNTIHHCGDNGIRIEDGADNNIISNTIHHCGDAGVIADDQSNLLLEHNLIVNNALDIGALAGIVITNTSQNIVLNSNQILDNGSGLGTYVAALYVESMASAFNQLALNDNVIYDTYGRGIYYAADNDNTSSQMQVNAICSTNDLELDNQRGGHTIDARYNWWGTNTPTLGANYAGSVNLNPWITLATATVPATIPADVGTNATIQVTMNDGAGNTVPEGARDVHLVASTGTIVPATVTLDGNGQANATFTLTDIPADDQVVITATAFCDYVVVMTITVERTNVAIAKTTSVAEVARGEPLLYTIRYTNTSSVMARNVYFTDTLPSGTRYQSHNSNVAPLPCSGCVVGGAGPLIWGPIDLPAFTTGIVTLTLSTNNTTCGDSLTNNVVIGTSTAENVYTDNNAQSPPVTIVGPDVTIGKTTAMSQAAMGGLINYTITYHNGGNAPANSVTLTDNLPPGTTYVSDDSSLACPACTAGSTGPLVWNAGALPANSPNYTFNLVLRVNNDPLLCGQALVNSANIATLTPECGALPNTANAPAVTVVGPDVTIGKTAASNQAAVGDLINYTITYRNAGDAPANSVTLTDNLPPGTTYVSDDSGLACPACTAGSTGPLVWNAGALPANSPSHSFNLVLRVNNDPLLCGQALVNNVNISTVTPECGALPNTANAPAVTVVGSDVTIGKTTATNQVVRGGLINYTITYRNGGDAPADNVGIADILPPGTTYVSDDSGLACPACTAGSTGPLVWDAGTLPANSPSHSFNLVLRVNNDPALCGQALVNSVNISTVTPECGALPNAANAPAVTVVGPDVTIGKTAATNQVVRGGLINYTITYRNGGAAPADGVEITDNLPPGTTYVSDASGLACPACTAGSTGPLVWNAGTLPANSPSYSFNLVLRVNNDPLLCGQALVNGISIATTTPECNALSNTANAPAVTVVGPDVTIAKTTVMTEVMRGDLFNYTITYRNGGAAPASGVEITDNLPPGTTYVSDDSGLACPACTAGSTGPLVWNAGTLPANSPVYSFDLTLRVNSSTPYSTTLVNNVNIATATPECGALPNADVSAGVHVIGHIDLVVLKDDDVGPSGSTSMSLAADKQRTLNRFLQRTRRNGPLAVSQHRDFVLEGDLVTYTISIVNVGNYTATNVVLSETLPPYSQYVGIGWTHVASRTYTQTVGALPPGAGRIYYFVVQIDDPIPLAVTDLDNLVCGWSDDDDLDPTDNCNPEDTPVRHPRLAITKTADTVLSKVGHGVTYTILVCNTGDVALNKQSVADTRIPGVNAAFGPSLAPGACESHDFARAIQPGDPDPLVNIARARYQVEGRPDRTLVATDNYEVNLFQPSITLAKTGDTLSKVGDDVTYVLTLNNTSSADTPNLACTITDAMVGINENVILASGASHTLTATYTVPAGASDPLVNTAQASCSPVGFSNVYNASANHSVNLFQPSIAFEKTGDALSKIGDPVNYTLTLHNTSSADTPNLECTITDAMLGINENVTLAPGGNHVINATHTVPAGAPDPLVNTAQVTCSPIGFSNVYNASDDHPVNLFQPSITFAKTGDALSKIGDPTDYTLTLNNTSSADTPNLVCTITDAMLGINENVTLASGTSHVINATYTVPAGAPDPLVNTAQVTCSPVGFPNTYTASDSHSVNLFQPSIAFDKTSGDTLSKAGDDVNYTLTLSNTSSADTPNLVCTITDAMVGINETVTLASGASHVFNATYTVPPGAADPLVNTAQVSCSPIGFPNVLTASDNHSINLFQPSITLNKTGDALSKVGDDVNYTLTLNNTSSADAPNLVCTITDAMVGINETVTLATGDSHVIDATYTVPASALDPLVNTAQASCSPVGFTNVLTTTDSHSVNLFQPSITLDKTGDALSKIGDPVNYTLTLHNTSSADTPNLVCLITDAMLGINETVTLGSGASRVINAAYTVPADASDPLVNTAQATCSPIGFPNVYNASDNHSVNLFQPAVEVEKTGPASGYVDNTITYTFRITNTGSADSPALILDSVIDVGDGWPGLGNLTSIARANGCDPLPPGNSCTFDAPYTIQPSDPNPLTNTVTVNFHPDGFTNVITHSDSHTVVTSVDVDLVVTKNDDVGPTTPTSARLPADKQAAVDRLLRANRNRAALAPAQFHREFVGPGDLITYTIVVINTGRSIATDVVVTETLPLYTTYVGYGWQQVDATRNYTMSLPNLPPQVGRVITFVVRIDNSLPPEVRNIINYVCGFSAEPDTDDTDNCRYTDTPVLNLGLDKEAAPLSILAGEQVTFTITLSNSSQVIGGSTSGVTITDDLPDGFTWITDTAETVGLTRVLTSPVVIWHTPSFTIGEHISFTLMAQTSPTIACGEWVTNVVTATVRVGDQEYNWMATAGVRIQCYIDLLVTKDDNVGPITPASACMNVSLTPEKQAIVDRVQREARASAPMAMLQQYREFVEPGDLITYTITIANVGAYTITNAVLSETIPLYTTYVGYGWTHLGGRNYITTVGTLPPGIGHVYFIVVRVDDPVPFGVHNLINYVCGWGDEPDEYPDNNCNYEDTPVHTEGQLYVANRNSGTLDVFNTTDFGYVTTIPVDVNPWGLATFGSYLYAGDFHEQNGQACMYIIDTDTNTVLGSRAVGSPVHSAHLAHMTVLTSTDVVSLYVTSHSGPPAIAVINAEPPWNILDEIALNRPDTWEFGFFGATTDTNRRCVYFTKRDFGGVGIWRLCPPSDTPEYVYSTNEGANEKPFSILYNPNDDLVYVAFALLNEVWIFDPDDFQLLDRVPTEVQDPTVHTGHGGQGLVAAGQYVFVSNYISESVTVITNGSVARQASAGLAALQAEFDHRIYLPMTLRNFSAQSAPPTLPVQPTQINTVTIRLSGRPKGMAATPHLLFVTLPREDRVAIIDTATLTVTQEISTVGDHPHSVIMVEGN